MKGRGDSGSPTAPPPAVSASAIVEAIQRDVIGLDGADRRLVVGIE